MNNIAILAWGSLFWEPRAAFDRWHDDWRTDGPALKLEFSRISGSRRGALTLVIDPESGALNTVAFAFSRRPTLDLAVADLREREGTSLSHIGFVCHGSGQQRCRDPKSREAIRNWGAMKSIDSVIWTDLPSNFAETTGTHFSIPAAIEYLRRLEPTAREAAIAYIRRAPAFIRTPLRDALERAPWFSQDDWPSPSLGP